MQGKKWLGLLVLLVLVLSACGGAAGAPDASTAPGAAAAVDSGEAGVQDGALAGDTPAQGVTSDDMADDDMADDDMAGDDMADDDMAGDSTSDDDMSNDDMSDDDMSDDDMADDDMSDDDMSDDDMSDDDMSDDDMSDDDMSDDDMSDDDMSDDNMSDDDMSDDDMSDDDMMALPGWLSAGLTDVTTGETFTLADFQGKVVLVETMAIWCPKCLQQQQEVLALHQALGMRDDLVTVALDIDPNEDAGSLKEYAARNGFDWYYAVAPRDLAREIGQLYGDQFLSPPATPMLIVDRHGEVHPLPFGLKTAADLQTALEPFLGQEDM